MIDDNAETEIVEKKDSKGTRIIKSLVRIILVLIVGLVLGAAAYFGLAFVYNETVVSNRAASNRMDQVVTAQAGAIKGLEERLGKVENRVSALENQQTTDRESNAELQNKLDGFQKTLEQNGSVLLKVATFQDDLDQLELNQGKDHSDISALILSLNAPDSPMAGLKRDVQVMKAMELLNRARSNFIRSNYGLAGEDMISARQVLAGLQSEAPEGQKSRLASWISRLDMALANLPSTPVLAFEDLEIAWEMMAGGAVTTPTPEPVKVITTTGIPPSAITPMPTTIPEPTLTPTITPTR